jgi:pimeloyl-ACP methyl ester carboxylesterase
MADKTRAHERLKERPLTGIRFTIEGVLPKPVEGLVARADGEVDLVIHFHGSSWLPLRVIEDSDRPLIVAAVNLGAGSGRYAMPFRDATVFPRLLERIRERAPFRNVYLTGFSAGYGAIREVLSQQPEAIAGVLLLDGLHTSYIPEEKPLAEGGGLDESKLEPFLAYGRRAAAGEKRLVITHSEIFPGTFASTTETSDYLLERLSMKRTPVLRWGPLGMQQLSESRRGSFIVYGFAGNTAPDHVDHLHGLGTFLRLLFD